MDKFRDLLPSTKLAYEHNDGLMTGNAMPSLAVIKFFLESPLAAAQLSKLLMNLCEKAYLQMQANLTHALFMSFNLVGISIAARLSALGESLLAACTHCYSAWRPAMLWVNSVRFVVIPSSLFHSLPSARFHISISTCYSSSVSFFFRKAHTGGP